MQLQTLCPTGASERWKQLCALITGYTAADISSCIRCYSNGVALIDFRVVESMGFVHAYWLRDQLRVIFDGNVSDSTVEYTTSVDANVIWRSWGGDPVRQMVTTPPLTDAREIYVSGYLTAKTDKGPSGATTWGQCADAAWKKYRDSTGRTDTTAIDTTAQAEVRPETATEQAPMEAVTDYVTGNGGSVSFDSLIGHLKSQQ